MCEKAVKLQLMVLVCTYDGYNIISTLYLNFNAYLFCKRAIEIVIFLIKINFVNCPCLVS